MKRMVTLTAAAFLLAGLVAPVLALDAPPSTDKKTEAVHSTKKHDAKTTAVKPTEVNPMEMQLPTATPIHPHATGMGAGKAPNVAKDTVKDSGINTKHSTPFRRFSSERTGHQSHLCSPIVDRSSC